MKNLKIYENFNKEGEYVLVRTLQSLDEFKDGIRVFQNPPFCEVLSDKDCEEEYNSYVDNGIAFGCFVDDKLAGINCVLYDVPEEYGIGFHDKDKVAYLSGLAVKEEFRKKGLGKLLQQETEKYLEGLDKYDYIFARIQCEGSMSAGIIAPMGYEDAYYNGELIVDNATYERNREDLPQSDARKFMVKTLNQNGNGWYRK